VELEAEIQSLREQLGKAKEINDVMWETVVQKVMVQEKQKAGVEGRDSVVPAGTGALWIKMMGGGRGRRLKLRSKPMIFQAGRRSESADPSNPKLLSVPPSQQLQAVPVDRSPIKVFHDIRDIMNHGPFSQSQVHAGVKSQNCNPSQADVEPSYPLRVVASRVEMQKLILATPNQATRELTIRLMSQLIQEVDIHIGWFGLALPQLVGHSDFTGSVIRTWNFGPASPQLDMHVHADSTRLTDSYW
jgi:hypothetical protein